MLDETILLGDKDFEKQMKEVVEPFLNQYEESGFIEANDGTRIHYYKYVQKKCLGHVVISHGFCEFAKKFEETIYYLLKSGYSVYSIEHRGHGYSDRKVIDNEKVYVKSYNEYVEDLHKFVAKVVPETNRYLFAHSMGGAVGILYLERYPEDFAKALLSSPMCAMKTGKYPKWSAALLAEIMCLFGRSQEYALGQKGFREPTFEKSSTLSRPRYMFYYNKRVDNTNYRTYGSTFAWVRASLRASIKLMRKSNLKKISCPVLLFQAGKDHLVDLKKQNILLETVSSAKMIRVNDAKHEIFNCRPYHRALFYKEVISFFEQ